MGKLIKGITIWSWIRLLVLPLGLTIYMLLIMKAESGSTLSYYLFANLFAIPFSLFVIAFWESLDGARIWGKFFLGIQPFLIYFFFVVN